MHNPAEYCRELERYLCLKNQGHLVRIVGPVFEQVCGWAAQGVPLAVAKKGIDAYCARYYAKGPKRRPVRIEFCEADILDLFDNWRRSVGVSTMDGEEGSGRPSGRSDTLAAHLDRVIARLTVLRGGGNRSSEFDRALQDAVGALDMMKSAAASARGAARAAIVERLASVDRNLGEAAARELTADGRAALQQEAVAEVAPFAARMPAAAREQAEQAAFGRLVRDAVGLPIMTFE